MSRSVKVRWSGKTQRATSVKIRPGFISRIRVRARVRVYG